MNKGVPPTPRKARTGLLTPPGITPLARSNRAVDCGYFSFIWFFWSSGRLGGRRGTGSGSDLASGTGARSLPLPVPRRAPESVVTQFTNILREVQSLCDDSRYASLHRPPEGGTPNNRGQF